MLQTGQILCDRYQISQQLGFNAIRQTWLAQDLQSDPPQTVIVKLLAFGGNVQWDELKLFEREAQILQQLNHSRIPKYLDYFSIDERFLWFGLVQERIPGSSLKELLEQGKRFKETEIRKIAKEILDILNYLHQLHPPVLHRDIKPSNLIYTEDEQVYLVDFGAVQDKAAIEGATFTVVGTYGYAPMEQFGGRATAASDLYALGATLIHLLTGIAPADLPVQDLKLQFRDCISASDDLLDWLEKLVEPAPERRFQSASEALEALSRGLNAKNSLTESAQRPFHSSVDLEKAYTHLRIERPSGFSRLSPRSQRFVMLGIAVVIAAFFLLDAGVWLFAIPIPMLIFFLLWELLGHQKLTHFFVSTQLDINFQRFLIKMQLLNFTVYQKGGATEAIQEINLDYQPNSSGTRYRLAGLAIMARSSELPSQFEKHLFGKHLSEAELVWLTQEIRNWLGSNRKRLG